MLQIQKMFQHI